MADPDGNEFCVLRALRSEELEAQGLVPGVEGQSVDGVTVERTPGN
jgi:hypothetical protein